MSSRKETPTGRVDAKLIDDLRREVAELVHVDVKRALQRAEFACRAAKLLDDPLSSASALRAKATAHWAAGKFERALALLDAAQLIYRERGNEVEAARIDRSKVEILMLLGRYDEALGIGEAARKVLERHNERVLLAQLDTNIGNVYHRLDQYSRALEFYDRARDVFGELGDKASVAMVEGNRANIFTYLNEFDQALSLYNQACDLLRSGGMPLLAAQTEYNAAYLHFVRGNYNEALKLFHVLKPLLADLGDPVTAALCDLDTLELYLELSLFEDAVELAGNVREQFTRLKMRYELAKGLAFGAIARLQLGDYARAQKELMLARALFEREGNEVYGALVNIYLSEAHLRSGACQEAISLSSQAADVLTRNNLPIKANYARLQLAKAHGRMGDSRAVERLCVEALNAFKDYEPPWLTYQLYHLLGGVNQETKKDAQAYAFYLKAIEAVERMRSNIRPDELKSTLLRDKLQVYQDMIPLCLEQHKTEEAFAFVDRAKSNTLVDLLARSFSVKAHGTIDEQLYRSWKKLGEELNWYYNKLNQRTSGRGERSTALHSRVENEIKWRERKLKDMLREVQLDDEEYSSLQNVTWATVAEVQRFLADDEALVEYYLSDKYVKIFVVGKDRTHVAHGEITREQLRTLLSTLKFQVEKFFYGAEYFNSHLKNLSASINGCLHRLYQELFAPIASHVAGKKLVIVPFDLLHYVPFHALYDGEGYVVDRHEVSYAPSASVFERLQGRPLQQGGDVLIMGVPDEFTPHIGEEVDAVKELFPEARLLCGAEASKANFIENAPSSRLIHLASHGTFRYDNPMFSAFKLADSWLTFYDIFNLPLEADLVTLSGCHSGLSKVSYGDELLGLMRGFLYAGSQSLVVSLWAVNDRCTAEFMKVLYGRLKEGYRKRIALRQAQLEIKEKYPHPYFWAPFVLVGKS